MEMQYPENIKIEKKKRVGELGMGKYIMGMCTCGNTFARTESLRTLLRVSLSTSFYAVAAFASRSCRAPE